VRQSDYCALWLEQFELLAADAIRVLSAQCSLAEVDLPCKIYGDVHGQFRDLLLLFRQYACRRVAHAMDGLRTRGPVPKPAEPRVSAPVLTQCVQVVGFDAVPALMSVLSFRYGYPSHRSGDVDAVSYVFNGSAPPCPVPSRPTHPTTTPFIKAAVSWVN
jgi:hypothetical protein